MLSRDALMLSLVIIETTANRDVAVADVTGANLHVNMDVCLYLIYTTYASQTKIYT